MNTQILLILAIIVMVSGFILIYFLLHKNLNSDEKSESALLLHQRLENLNKSLLDQLNAQTQRVNEQLRENQQSLVGTNKAVGERLDNAARVVGELKHQLGELGEATKQVFFVGKDIASLQEILRAPKLRGGLGELFLGDLLAQLFPTGHYTLQYRFKNGDIVDAIVRLRDDKLVPIDAKFPLENFRKMLDAPVEDEKTAFRKQFVNDVKKHIDKIAKSYILPDEGTLDFALMYVPAENIYYETIIRGDEHSIMNYAYERRVIPVSPNTFFAYIQSILLGLRGMQVEKSAALILKNLERLRGDLAKFNTDFELVGTHLTRAKNSYEESFKRLNRFEDKLTLASPSEFPEIAAEVLPLPPTK